MTTITARPAEPNDAKLLFRWVNSDESLANKRLTSKPITWEDHQRWFARKLKSDGVCMFVVNRDRAAIGQVRFELVGSTYIVDIFLAPEARNRRIAGEALELCISQLPKTQHKAVSLRADVKSSNVASMRLFAKQGFTRIDTEGDFVTFVRPLESSGQRMGRHG